MNLVGFHEAGKTSLAKRLMGNDFDADVKSTEGIALHYIKLTEEQWNEADIRADDRNKEVIEEIKKLGDAREEQESNNQKNTSMPSTNVKTTNAKTDSLQRESNFFLGSLVKKIWSTSILFVGSLIPLFWTCGDICPRFQIQDDSPMWMLRSLHTMVNFFSKQKVHGIVTPIETELSMSPSFKELALAHSDSPSNITSDDNVQFTVRLWDLGGQNDFQSTHHLFLDVDATTVIVMDITKEFSEQFEHPDKDLKLKQSNPSSPEEIMHYWLSSFHEEAKKKEEKTNERIDPDIFIVLTHIDDYRTEDEKKERIKWYEEQINRSLREKKYSHLVKKNDIFAIDNKTGTEETFQKLKKRCFESLSQQQTWNKTMPLKWLLLEADILEKKEEGQKYMTLKQMEESGKSVGMDSNDIKLFLKVHNAVGTFLCFDDEQEQCGNRSIVRDGSIKMEDFIITDPQWLVDMCKEVITHPEFFDERKKKTFTGRRVPIRILEKLEEGKVTDKSLNKLWDDKTAPYLTKLMLKHNIFIPLAELEEEGRQYLIPCMLPMGNKNLEKDKHEERILLYDGVHKAGCGQWFRMGTYGKLLAALINSDNWHLSSSPYPSYNRVAFKARENIDLSLQLTLEESPNFRAMMYCSPTKVGDETLRETLKQTLEQTRRILSDTTEQIDIQCEKDLETFCPYYGLQEDGLELILPKDKIDQLNCPCHSKRLTKNNYTRFKKTYVCKF